jgi:hypothetical protein
MAGDCGAPGNLFGLAFVVLGLAAIVGGVKMIVAEIGFCAAGASRARWREWR